MITLAASTARTARAWVSIFALFLLSASPSVLAATATLNPVADAYVQAGANAAKNYGTTADLRIRTSATTANNLDSYLRYDTTSVAGTISNAKLRIYAKLSATGTVSTTAYAVANTTWGETTLTWNNKPARGAALGSVTVNSTTYAWKEIDVTSYVQSEYAAGRKVMSFAYHNSANTSPYITAYSKNSTNANKPQLLITYATNSAPSVSLTAPINGATFTAPATVNLTATATDIDGTIVSVQYYNGTILVATGGAAPTFAATWSGVAAGTYSLTAKATDNSGAVTTSSPISITVNAPNQAPSVSITAPTTGATYVAPATVNLTATATDLDGTVTKVEYYNSTALVATGGAAPTFAATWSGVAAGTYSLTAKATDNSGAVTTSSPISITVAANNPPTVSLTTPSNGATFTAPANVTLAATATDTDGTIQKVDFYQGGALLGSIGSAPYTYNLPSLATGSYSFTAVTTDDKGATATSSAVTITVNASTSMVPPINYSYDEVGRLTSMFDSIGNSVQYGYDPVGNLLSTTRKSAGAVTILEFAPDAAEVGATVTITGTGFSATPSQNSVKFNGTAATVTSATINSLQVTVPTGATSGPISVTTPSGSATSTSNFIVSLPGNSTSAPTITSFTPTIGVAGTVVTITGTNFQTNLLSDKVTINNLPLTVTAATSTSLTVTIPTIMGSGKIRVTTPYGSALSGDNFVVVPPGKSVSDVGATGIVQVDGNTQAFAIPSAGKIGLFQFDGKQGQNLGLGVTNVSISPANGDFRVYLDGPSGTQLFDCTTYRAPIGAAGNDCDLPKLPSTGTYTLRVVPQSGYSASFSLTLSTEITGSITPYGGTSKVTTTRPGQNARYTFSASAGQYVGLAVTNSQIPGITSFHLYRSDTGTEFVQGSSSTSHTVVVEKLPITGEYSVWISPSGIGFGSLDLAVGVPDLKLSNLALGTPVANADGTFSIAATFNVTNMGTIAVTSATWHDSAFLSADGVLDTTDVYVGEQYHGGETLAAGASYPVSITLRTLTSTPPGNYTLFVKADAYQTYSAGIGGYLYSSDSLIKEQDETNNTLSLPVSLSLPDLKVSNLALGTPIANADGTFSIAATFNVTNMSTMALSPSTWHDSAFLSVDGVLDTSDIYIGELFHGETLAAGASYPVSITLRTLTSTPPGNYTVFVKTDAYQTYSSGIGGYLYSSDSLIKEQDETNNTQSLPVSLSLPDLKLSNLVLGTPIANADGTFSFTATFNVTNMSTMALSPSTWHDVAFLSADGVLDTTDVYVGEQYHGGETLAAGASYPVSITLRTLTSTPPGNYTLFVKADAYQTYSAGIGGYLYSTTDALKEQDETNNTQAAPVTLP